MAGEGRVGVVEADHEPDAELVLAHRVDEAAAELVPLRALAKRPAHRVDHLVERLLDLPDLLHAELPAHRQRALEVEVVDRRLGQVAERALGEHGRLRDHVRAGLEVAERLAVLAAAAVARAHAANDPVGDQQLVGDRLGEDVGALLLRLLGEEARQLRDRDHVVAVVAEVRRHRLQRQRRPLGQQVDRVLGHLLVGERPVVGLEVRETAPASPAGFMFAPESSCAPATLPFSSTATGTSPSFSVSSGSSASRSRSRFAQARPAGPPPAIATPTSIRSSSGSVGSAISSRSSNGGG